MVPATFFLVLRLPFLPSPALFSFSAESRDDTLSTMAVAPAPGFLPGWGTWHFLAGRKWACHCRTQFLPQDVGHNLHRPALTLQEEVQLGQEFNILLPGHADHSPHASLALRARFPVAPWMVPDLESLFSRVLGSDTISGCVRGLLMPCNGFWPSSPISGTKNQPTPPARSKK